MKRFLEKHAGWWLLLLFTLGLICLCFVDDLSFH